MQGSIQKQEFLERWWKSHWSMMDQQQSSWTVKKSYSHKAKKRSVKIVSFNHDKKTQIKNVDIKAEKEWKREKNKKEQEKALQKGERMVI